MLTEFPHISYSLVYTPFFYIVLFCIIIYLNVITLCLVRDNWSLNLQKDISLDVSWHVCLDLLFRAKCSRQFSMKCSFFYDLENVESDFSNLSQGLIIKLLFFPFNTHKHKSIECFVWVIDAQTMTRMVLIALQHSTCGYPFIEFSTGIFNTTP